MNPAPAFSAITASSLIAWALALLWAALIFISIAGYGALLLRVFGIKKPSFTLSSIAGYSLAIFLGGILNLFHLIYPAALIAFILAGSVLAALFIARKPESAAPLNTAPTSKSLTSKLLLSATVLVFSMRIASSVHDCVYQPSDDMNYYLAAPKKMLQTHSFAPDPYSERRTIASVGGNQFLDTLILSAQPLEEIQMADWTHGVFLLALLAFALGHEFELNQNERYLLAFLLLFTPQLRFNLTFVVLPSALFIAMVYVAAHRLLTTRYPILQALLIGGSVGVLTTTKSTYLTHGAIFILCIAIIRWWKHDFFTAVRFAAIASFACLIVMSPWMLANHLTSQSWLFPILGKGFHYTAYHHYASPSHLDLGILFKKVIPFCVPLIAMFAVEFFWGERNGRVLAISALMMTACLASILNGIATGGDSVRRYNYPCILPAITLSYIVFARRKDLAPRLLRWRVLQVASLVIALTVAIDTGTQKFTSEYLSHWRCLRASLAPYRITTQAYRNEYAALQQALPIDSAIMATVDKPFLLDFTHRNILIADFPGAASPKPGWPTWEDGTAFRQFLLEHNVRYLMYSYGDCHYDPLTTCDSILDAEQLALIAKPSVTNLIRNEAIVGYQARHQYQELARTQRHIYDDGRIYILDLTESAI